MQRRKFIKDSLTGVTGIIAFSSFTNVHATAGMMDEAAQEANFFNPPDASRPWVFWMWMNGHITKEGITADLEAMKRMGIGGVIIFNSAVGIPRGPVDYASNEWMEAIAHAGREAERLGIELTLHNAPGYSGCGGPWVTPDRSMQQLVWTETLANSNGNIEVQLPKPYAKLGYYRDALVVAYPSLPVEKILMKERLIKVTVNQKEIDKNILTDGTPEIKIRLEAEGKNAILQLEFAEPFEARAITILRKAETPRDLFDGPRDHPPVLKLESSDDGVSFTFIGTIKCPELREMDTPASLSFNAVSAKYYRLVANTSSWISNVELHNGPRLSGWPGKVNYTHGDFGAETPPVEKELLIDPSLVVDITGKMDAGGKLYWMAPEGKWTILRIGHTTTGEECAAHPDSGKGLEIDKFSKEALDFHFTHFLNHIITRLKPYKTFKGIAIDSWEAGKQNWTTGFPALFKKKNNYSIIPWMPALTGRIVDSIEESENFLWDVRRTQANLLSENFYGHYKTKCRQHGLELYAEPYGDGNLDSLQIAQHLDITMAEFWTRYIYGSDITSKQASSAAHVYGKKIVASEAFTAMPATSKWTDYPYSLKAQGDYFFSLGINRLIFHVFVHQPYMTGTPGMTMGPFGIHIDRNNTWTDQACGWIKYIQRTQHLLQQGQAVADICYFRGDNPESGVPDTSRFLPAGYKADVIGAEALHNYITIKNGKIVLAGGMTYRLCIMAPLQQILPATGKRIKELVKEGMILIVSAMPLKAWGKASDAALRSYVNELYGRVDGQNLTERNYGKGKIIWSNKPADVLSKLKIQPDFSYTAESPDAAIHFSHRKLGEIDFYFICNQKRKKEKIVASFRIDDKHPEIWNSENGKIYNAVLFERVNGTTQLPLELEPAGSLFIVFRKKNVIDGYTAVLKNGVMLASTHQFEKAKPGLYADVQNNFTISIWLKPDTFAHPGKSMLFYAPDGETVYGKGHAAMGLSAGQNTIRVYEKSRMQVKEVVSFNHSIEGWTHVAVIYKNGSPLLYVNGKPVAQNTASGNIVHPGLTTPAAPGQFSNYFEGNHTPPQLFREVLNDEQIKKLFSFRLPHPLLPEGLHLTKENNRLKALVWENGNYALQCKQQIIPVGNVSGCGAVEISDEWKVQFPRESGAPPQITLPSLISLHKHTNFDIKHFSGTCTYSKIIHIEVGELQPGRKLYLHLGRVEVIAEVNVNGKKLGLLWKEPFMIDVTKAVKAGDNLLQIAVTNLWPNRLIGDEYLPPEHKFTEHKFIKELPHWYLHNQPKPGKRKSFVVWKTHEKNDPLLEAGLLGPVKLLTAMEIIIR